MRLRNWLLTGTSLAALAMLPGTAFAQQAEFQALQEAQASGDADAIAAAEQALTEVCIVNGFASVQECIAAITAGDAPAAETPDADAEAAAAAAQAEAEAAAARLVHGLEGLALDRLLVELARALGVVGDHLVQVAAGLVDHREQHAHRAGLAAVVAPELGQRRPHRDVARRGSRFATRRPNRGGRIRAD